MRGLFTAVLILISPLLLRAQEHQYSTTDRAAIKHYAKANEYLDQTMTNEAMNELQEAIKADDNFWEAHALLGDVYHQMRDHKDAVEQYDKAISLNQELSHIIYLRVAQDEVALAKY